MTGRRGSFPNGSGLVQLPRGSFIVDNGRHIEADAILQPPPTIRVLSSQQRAPHPIVLRAITHPVSQSRAAAGCESHECPKRRTDSLRHPTAFVSLVNASLRSEEDGGVAAGCADIDVSQHRLYDRCIRPLSCYASHRPQQRPSHYQSVITRSLVGRPVMQFRGRSVGTDRARRDRECRQPASQIVNLADDSASESYSDTSPDGSASAPICPSVPQPGMRMTSIADRLAISRRELDDFGCGRREKLADI